MDTNAVKFLEHIQYRCTYMLHGLTYSVTVVYYLYLILTNKNYSANYLKYDRKLFIKMHV